MSADCIAAVEEWRAAEAWLDGDDLDELFAKTQALMTRTPQSCLIKIIRSILLFSPVVQVMAARAGRDARLHFKKHRSGGALFVMQTSEGLTYSIAEKRDGGAWTYSDEPGIIRRGEPCPRAIALAFDELPELPPPVTAL